MLLISTIPSICITPAPPEKKQPEPYSPFSFAELDLGNDRYRANHLSLPPSAGSSPWHSSPLRPAERPARRGLSRDQFNSLLKASRDQRVKFGLQKVPDLRKELALKNQSPKQVERRARFLSKVNESSSIPTISIPEVPLESPATIRYPISSYAFKSEYSALEIREENSEDLVVFDSTANPGHDEQVERGLRIAVEIHASSEVQPVMPNKSRRILPSLDEIMVRLKTEHMSSKRGHSRSWPPNFPKASSVSLGSIDDQIQIIPVRTLAVNDGMFDITTQQVNRLQHPDSFYLTPGSGRAVTSHTVDLVAGPTRADAARDMIVTLRRRSSQPPDMSRRERTRIGTVMRRRSAPAEL